MLPVFVLFSVRSLTKANHLETTECFCLFLKRQFKCFCIRYALWICNIKVKQWLLNQPNKITLRNKKIFKMRTTIFNQWKIINKNYIFMQEIFQKQNFYLNNLYPFNSISDIKTPLEIIISQTFVQIRLYFDLYFGQQSVLLIQ